MANTKETLFENELPAIPELRALDGWKQIPIIKTERSSEPLVPLGIFSEHRRVLTSSVYAGEHHNSPYSGGLEGSNITAFARENVAHKLDKAAERLPRGYHLLIMDAYRSIQVQAALYEHFDKLLRKQYPEWSDDEIATEAQKYISQPSTDETKPAPHNTGGVIDTVIIKVDDEIQNEIDLLDKAFSDLADDNWQDAYLIEMKRSELLRRNGKMLEFGTRFDHGGPESALRYFEEKQKLQPLTDKEKDALNNRRLLYSVMTEAGFAPYADEWWHFNDSATQMGAAALGKEYAEYGPAHLDANNINFEQMRKAQHDNSVKHARGETWTPPKGLEVHFKLAKVATFANNPMNMWELTETVAKLEPVEEEKAA